MKTCVRRAAFPHLISWICQYTSNTCQNCQKFFPTRSAEAKKRPTRQFDVVDRARVYTVYIASRVRARDSGQNWSLLNFIKVWTRNKFCTANAAKSKYTTKTRNDNHDDAVPCKMKSFRPFRRAQRASGHLSNQSNHATRESGPGYKLRSWNEAKKSIFSVHF